MNSYNNPVIQCEMLQILSRRLELYPTQQCNKYIRGPNKKFEKVESLNDSGYKVCVVLAQLVSEHKITP